MSIDEERRRVHAQMDYLAGQIAGLEKDAPSIDLQQYGALTATVEHLKAEVSALRLEMRSDGAELRKDMRDVLDTCSRPAAAGAR